MTEPRSKTFNVSWAELHRDAKALSWRLAELGSWGRAVAIARGGIIPTAIVARELGVRLIDTVCIASYDHMTQGGIRVLKEAAGDGEDTLLVDDLVDTGRTARIVREMLPKAFFATVYAKPEGLPLVDLFLTDVSQDTWIHFPWDTELHYARPVAERLSGP